MHLAAMGFFLRRRLLIGVAAANGVRRPAPSTTLLLVLAGGCQAGIFSGVATAPGQAASSVTAPVQEAPQPELALPSATDVPKAPTHDDTPDVGPQVEWPNSPSAANSDPWLVAHHKEITKMRPRLMVMNFENGRTDEVVRQVSQKLIAALAEGSRYQAYKNPQAPVFVQYEIVRIANLIDPDTPPGCPNTGHARSDCSSRMTPRRGIPGAREWDYAQMFTQAFADIVGWKDPNNPQHAMTLCELFERGFVHEVWLNDPTSDGPIAEILSRAPIYDQQRAPTDAYTLCAGNGCFSSEADGGGCKVTVRLANIAFDRGPGCGTHAFGHAMEQMRVYIPYLAANSTRFFNFDLDKRLGADFETLYQTPYYKLDPSCPPASQAFLAYDGSGGVEVTVVDAGHPCGRFAKLSGVWDGCGNVHFPPNATQQYDYYAEDAAGHRIAVSNTCENYGEGGGDQGADPRTDFTYAKARAGDQMGFDDCGGGWQIYLRQSMPGLGNRATAADGLPMLNWWPFLFY